MSGLFGPSSITVPSPPAVPPPVRQPAPADQASQAAETRAQQQLMNMRGVEASDLTGPGSARGNQSSAYTGTVLGK